MARMYAVDGLFAIGQNMFRSFCSLILSQLRDPCAIAIKVLLTDWNGWLPMLENALRQSRRVDMVCSLKEYWNFVHVLMHRSLKVQNVRHAVNENQWNHVKLDLFGLCWWEVHVWNIAAMIRENLEQHINTSFVGQLTQTLFGYFRNPYNFSVKKIPWSTVNSLRPSI